MPFIVLDAWSTGDTKFSYGRVSDLGKRDSCLKIHVDLENNEGFLGKYCVVKVNFPLPSVKPGQDLDPTTAISLNLPPDLKTTVYDYYADRIAFFYRDAFSFGICIPSTCSRTDINNILTVTAEGTELNVTLRKYCDSFEERQQERVPFSTHIMAALLILMLIAVLMSTVLNQAIVTFGMGIDTKYIKCFDIIINTKRLVTAGTNPHYNRMRAAEPLKGLSQICAICGHALATGTLITVGFCELQQVVDSF